MISIFQIIETITTHQNVVRQICRIFTLVFTVQALLFAEMDSIELQNFYIQHEDKYRTEYRECTGDSSSKVSIKKIIAWRHQIHDIAASPAYRHLLADYIGQTGRTRDIQPCVVIKWQQSRTAVMAKKDEEISLNIQAAADSIVDSIIVAENMANNPTSSCDFGCIPFGVTRAAFRWVFADNYKLPLIDMGNYLYTPSLQVNGRTYLAAFHFTRGGRYFKYEFEDRDHDADSLNLVTRKEAEYLVAEFQKRLGEPPQRLRVSQFDIKQKELAVIARWYKFPLSVYVGFSAQGYRHYAKAIVMREGL